MKIDGNRYAQDAEAARGADSARGTDASGKVTDRGGVKTADPTRSGGTDRVELSADAKLLSAALKAVETESIRTQPVRPGVVEAMKTKLAAGDVGNDSGRLADRIIDDLLEG